MKSNNLTRRNFIQKSAIGLGMGTMAVSNPVAAFIPESKLQDNEAKLPREVWIASLTQLGMNATNYKDMVKKVLQHLEELKPYKPDIICLPETFPFAANPGDRIIKDVAEKPLGPITQPFADYAKANNCYIICPTYTVEKGEYYNAAVVIDRQGLPMGEYRKIHPTIGEIEKGIAPGPVDPPVFKTDFGVVGIQLCFDIDWDDAWKRLRNKGAEIVFWPSSFGGGQRINTMVWQYKYIVVSSTNTDSTRICDISGEIIASTGRWNPRWICAPVNLEKVFLQTWPNVRRYGEIKAKYGRKVSITNFDEEGWSIIESLSPDVKVADIMKEFDLISHKEHIEASDAVQVKARK